MSSPTANSFEVTLNTVGDFAYHCDIHPSMQGVVQVIADAGAEQTAPATAAADALETAADQAATAAPTIAPTPVPTVAPTSAPTVVTVYGYLAVPVGAPGVASRHPPYRRPPRILPRIAYVSQHQNPRQFRAARY
jgi:hypothetical protein